jgi:hypothetical protein
MTNLANCSIGKWLSQVEKLRRKSAAPRCARSDSAAAAIPACVIKVKTERVRNEEAAAPNRS